MRLLVTRLTITSATSWAVTTRWSGGLLARRAIRFSYLSFNILAIQSPSIQPGATAVTRITGPRFSANSVVRLAPAALRAADANGGGPGRRPTMLAVLTMLP